MEKRGRRGRGRFTDWQQAGNKSREVLSLWLRPHFHVIRSSNKGERENRKVRQFLWSSKSVPTFVILRSFVFGFLVSLFLFAFVLFRRFRLFISLRLLNILRFLLSLLSFIFCFRLPV